MVTLRRLHSKQTVRLSFYATLKSSDSCDLVVKRENSDPRALKYLGAHLQSLAQNAPNTISRVSFDSWQLSWPRAEWLRNGWFFPLEGPLMLEYQSYLGKLARGRLDSLARYEVVDVKAMRG